MSSINITSRNHKLYQSKLNSTVLDIKEVKYLKNYFKTKGGIDSNHALTEKNNTQMKDSNFTYTIYLGTPQGSTLDFCSEKRLCVQGFAEYLYENNTKGTQQFAVSIENMGKMSLCDNIILHELSNFATNYMFPTIVSNSIAFYRDNRPPYGTDILYLSKPTSSSDYKDVDNAVEFEYPFSYGSDGILKELKDSAYGRGCYTGAFLGFLFGSVIVVTLALFGLFEISARCERRWRIRAFAREREQENNGALEAANQQGNYDALAEAVMTEPEENSQSNYVALANIDSQNIETNKGLDPNKY